MKKALGLGALGLLLSVSAGAGFLLFAPVSAVSPRVADLARDNGIALVTDASVARGGAQVSGVLAPGQELQLNWRFLGAALRPTGALFELALSGVANGQTHVIVSPTLDSAHLVNGQFAGSVTGIAPASDRFLAGQVSVSVEKAELHTRRRSVMALKGQGLWKDAAITLDETILLGEVHGKLSAEGENQVRIAVSNADAQIALSGVVSVDLTARRVDLDLLVHPPLDDNGTLRAVLDGWGTPEGDAYRVKRPLRF